eukprot:SAG25_NODE_1153_length_3771_cov_5.694989_5_plen_81_part_00
MALAKAAIHSQVSRLGLGDNHLGVGGAAAVAQLLACSARLSALNLRGNRIGDAGGERALPHCMRPFGLAFAYTLRVLVMK